MFKNDVPLEKQLKTQSLKNISSKVIENWINQTLSAAEHLDIPHAILKPKNQVPVTRYGIDRNKLQLSGLSEQQTDRIYRALFVYSVGFYELLKDQLNNCSPEDSLELLMNLWKAY